MSLVGVLLVINSSRGHQVVFRYPTTPLTIHTGNDEAPIQYSYDKRINSQSADGHGTQFMKDNMSTAKTEIDRYLNFELQYLGDIMSPKIALCDKCFRIGVDNFLFIGHPVLVQTQRKSVAPMLEANDDEAESSHPFSMGMFNVIFLLHNDHNADLTWRARIFHEQVVKRIAMVLKHEQIRNEYVRTQCKLILDIYDQFKPHPEDFMLGKIFSESSLARELVEIYENLQNFGCSHVLINNRTPVSVHLETPDDSLIQPYLTVILLEKAEDLIKNLTLDFKLDFIDFSDNISPKHNLEQTQKNLGWSWAKVKSVASHLLYWKKAKVINVIHLESRFVSARNGPWDEFERVLAEWKEVFPGLDMLKFLSRISRCGRLGDLGKSDEHKQIVMNAAAFLLKHGYLHQLETRLFAKIPKAIKSDLPLQKQTFELLLTDDIDSLMVEKLLKALSSPQDPNLLKKLLAVLAYCDGDFSIDEICWRKKISHREFAQIMQSYNNILIPFTK